jgi:hypothetical protein
MTILEPSLARQPKETIPAERPPPDAPEHVRAEWWRVHVAKLSRPSLADRIGKSPSYVARMEAGQIGSRAIDAEEYKIYRLACAAITAGVDFDWIDARLEIAPGVRITRSATGDGAG